MLLNSLLGVTWYPITFDSPLNIARGICFWLAVALLVALLAGVLLCKGEKRSRFLRIALFTVLGYALLAGAVLLILTYLKDGITLILFLPLLLLILCLAGLSVAFFLRAKKTVLLPLAALTGAALIAALVCMGVYFGTGDPAVDNGLTDNGDVNQLGLYLSAPLFIAALLAATFLLGKDEKDGFDSRSIAYAGVCIAISFALSYLRLVKMPQGGSITLASLLPIMLYSYMFGVKKGVFAGFICGLLQAVQDPVILHPMQFLLDYPVPFACIGLAGMFARTKKLEKLPQLQIALGGIVAGLARFAAHYLSGCFAFGAFAPAGQPVWLYSLIYQSGYVLPDIAIAIAVGVLVFCSKGLVKQARKFHTPATENEP